MKNIAVFASHNGSDLQTIIDACKEATNTKVVLVISNNSDAYALERARDAEINSYCVNNDMTPDVSETILDLLAMYQVDIIILAGYMKKIDELILSEYENNIYNIHPSLLPKFGGKGMYGINVHRAVIESGDNVTGATIHRVSNEYDDGLIVMQEAVPVLNNDTPEALANRVLLKEHEMLAEFIKKIDAGEF